MTTATIQRHDTKTRTTTERETSAPKAAPKTTPAAPATTQRNNTSSNNAASITRISDVRDDTPIAGARPWHSAGAVIPTARADLSSELLARVRNARLGGVGQVPRVDGTPTGRTTIDTLDGLASAVRNNTLQNADVRVDVDLSVLKLGGGRRADETYTEFSARVVSENEAAVANGTAEPLTDAQRETLRVVGANPDLNWNGLFAGKDLTNTTFHGEVNYANFANATGSNVRFAGPVTEGWFLGANLPNARFEGGVTGTNFTGAQLRGATFAGDVSRNAFNDAHLEGANLEGVTSFARNDCAFAHFDGARFPAGIRGMSEGSTFTGAVMTGATNAPPAEATIPSIDLSDPALIESLGGRAEVERLMREGGLFDKLVSLGEPYASAVQNMLGPSWRSYIADGLGDGQPIKPWVYDAVDGRYGAQTDPEYPGAERPYAPTLANLYANQPVAQPLIDRALGELILRGGRLDDPMGLSGSASGLTRDQWVQQSRDTSVFWPSALAPTDGTYGEGSRTLAATTIPRPTIDELYRVMEQRGMTDELARLRALDHNSGLTIDQIAAAYPGATQVLYEIYGGAGR
jgi:uncharacterized protein YjbI with pentapeptide repeats